MSSPLFNFRLNALATQSPRHVWERRRGLAAIPRTQRWLPAAVAGLAEPPGSACTAASPQERFRRTAAEAPVLRLLETQMSLAVLDRLLDRKTHGVSVEHRLRRRVGDRPVVGTHHIAAVQRLHVATTFTFASRHVVRPAPCCSTMHSVSGLSVEFLRCWRVARCLSMLRGLGNRLPRSAVRPR